MSELDDYRAELIEAAERYAADRERVRKSRDHVANLVYLCTRRGMTEVDAAKLAGVSRMTIRAWLGKG